MGPLFETVTDLATGAETIRRRSYGIIETAEGKLVGVHFRPWPSLITLPDVWLGDLYHGWTSGDRCWVFYNEPPGSPGYLALTFAISNGETRLETTRCAARVLDEIARLRQADAIVTEATCGRISDRLLARWGWERHVLDSPLRHWIKRFYGVYPPALA